MSPLKKTWELSSKNDTQVEQRVKEVVNAVLEKTMDSANAATSRGLAKQISELKTEVNGLKA
jgi:hypothetical protein